MVLYFHYFTFRDIIILFLSLGAPLISSMSMESDIYSHNNLSLGHVSMKVIYCYICILGALQVVCLSSLGISAALGTFLAL